MIPISLPSLRMQTLRKTLSALLTAFALVGAVRADQVLIPTGAVWRYLDNGSDPGAAWAGVAFADGGWASGPAQLGYGDGDEATVVGYGSNASAKHITTHFRHRFSVADPGQFAALDLRVMRDDGVVVYLNGVEVFRNNLPSGPITIQTLAGTALGGADESVYLAVPLPASHLVAGENVVAAEVHQANGTSSDISFDLGLTALEPGSASVVRGPYLQKAGSDRITIRWRTSVPTDSRVRFGVDASQLGQAVADPSLVTDHSVELTGLESSTRYHYAVGNSSGDLRGGADCFFYTAPPTGTVQPLRFWVLGDAGTGTSGQAAVRNAYAAFTANRYTDLVLLLGDNAYDNGTDAEYQAKVFDIYGGLLPSSAVVSTLGNHDTAQTTTPDVATTPYFSIFDLPADGELGGVPSGTEKYYSLDYGNVHVVCLDSMTSDRSPSGPMLTWLAADLAQNTADWLIAIFHHPPYTKGSHDSDTETALVQMRVNALPILEAYGVDLVLGGHSHSYERSYLLDSHYGTSGTLLSSMVVDPGDGREDGNGAYRKGAGPVAHQGAVYAVPGSAGKISGGSLNHPAMFLSLNNLGSMVIDVFGSRLDAWFVRETGALDDHFTLIKGDPANNPPAVAIVSPAEGASYAASTPVLLAAEAFDSDGQVTGVEFLVDGVAAGVGTEVSPGRFEATVGDVPVGSHSVTAVALDDLGAQGASDPVGFLIVIPPAAPSGLEATAVSASEIALGWMDGSDNEDGFSVERSVDGQVWEVATTLGAGVTSWTDAGLPGSATRHYRVSAYNAAGSSAYSNEASATTWAPPLFIDTAPSADLPVLGSVSGSPADLAAADGIAQVLTESESGGKPSNRTSLLEHGWRFDAVPGGLAVTVMARAWASANGEGDDFLFEASLDGGATWTGIFTVYAGSTSANAPSAVLPAGTRGEVRVRVRDLDRTAGRRNLDAVTVDQLILRTDLDPNDTPPAPPESVTAAVESSAAVRITWTDASDNELGFAIERSINGGAFAPLATVGPGAGTYLDGSALPATTHQYRVRSFTTSHESIWVGSNAVVTPDGLALTASGSKQKGVAVADLAWSGGASLTDVQVWRRLNAGAWELRATVPNSGAYRDNTGLKGGLTLEYQLRSVDGSVESNGVTLVF